MTAHTTGWTTFLRDGREALRVERVKADPTALTRASAALLAALVLGPFAGSPTAGAMLAAGAFLCGLGTLISPLRHHAVNALAVALAVAALSALGALVHGMTWLLLVVLALAAAGAGLWRALGHAPGLRARLCVIALLLTGDLAQDLPSGLAAAGWIGVGSGLVVLAQLFPPYGSRFPAQRQSLAGLYDALAVSAGEPSGPVAASPFAAARRALEVLPERSRPHAAPLYGLLGESERLRRAIESVRGQQDAPTSTIAAALTGIARTVESGRWHEITERTWDRLDAWVQHSPAQSPRALVTRLREADRLAQASTSDQPAAVPAHTEVAGTRAATSPLQRTADRLLAELTPRTPVFRHSLRLAGGVVLAEVIGRAVGSWGGPGVPAHGFWIALTALLVLFPDYGSSVTRGWSRAAGSVLGALLATLLAQIAWPPVGSAIAVALLGFAAFLTLRSGQLVVNLWLTAWFAFLVQQVGAPAIPTAWERAGDAVIGAALAMLVLLVWPTWSARRLLDHLASWLRLLDRLLPALVAGQADPSSADRAEIEQFRALAREQQEQLEAAILRAEAEPAQHRSPWTAEQLGRIQAEVHRIARHTSQLAEHLPTDAAQSVPEFTELGALLHQHLAELARSAAGRRPVRPGELRATFTAFTERNALGRGDLGGDRRARAVALCAGAVDGVEDLARTLATRPVRRSAEGLAEQRSGEHDAVAAEGRDESVH